MKILELLENAVNSLSREKVAESLQVSLFTLDRWISGKGKPSFEMCQKIIDSFNSLDQNDCSNATWVEKDEMEPEASNVQLDIKTDGLWEGKDVCLCLPLYKPVEPETFISILAMWDRSKMRAEFKRSEAMVSITRNRLANKFLKTPCNWSFWIDHDVVIPCGNAGLYRFLLETDLPDQICGVNTIARLVSHGKSVVGGCYWDHHGKGSIMAKPIGRNLPKIPFNGIYEVEFCGTGCLAIHRKVFEDIASNCDATMTSKKDGEYGFFDTISLKGIDREDMAFAWRAAQLGHKSYLDLSVICGHIGSKIHTVPNSVKNLI